MKRGDTTRKWLVAAGLFAGAMLLTVVLGAGIMIVSFARSAPIRDGFEIVPGVRTIKERFVALYVVDLGGGKVALVDAGIDPAAKPILAELARRGLGPDAVAAILLTHGHGDHRAGCAAFPRSPVWALEADVALAEGRARSGSPMGRLAVFRSSGVRIGRVLHDGETIRLGKTAIRVFAVPGHTPGSAAYLIHGVLFLGDAADARKDGRLTGAKWFFSESVEQNRSSLKALVARLRPGEVKALAFGHSGALPGLQPLLDFAAQP